MQLHELQRKHKNKAKKRIGRGGIRGKTSGRGHKGQKQHGGHGIRPEMRDIIKKIPKLRGHGKNRARTVHDSRTEVVVVNVATLESIFGAGAEVNPKTLVSHKVIRLSKGKKKAIKILGNGDLSKKLIISGCFVSKSARKKITSAAGSIV